MLKSLIFIFLGGGLGSVSRYALGSWLNFHLGNFPLGTFLANIIGSLIIGLVAGFSFRENILTQNQTLFLATGFCGGFTTFSTFNYENFLYLEKGQPWLFLIYTSLSFSLGLIAVFAGIALSKL